MAFAVVEMEADKEMYPIETVTNFGMYQELKPAKKPEKNNEKKEDRGDVKLENDTTNRIYKSYKKVEKEQLFALVYEKGMSASREAALKLHITPRTAHRWIANNQGDPQTYNARKKGNEKPVGRPAVMNDRQKTHLVDLIDKEPELVLDQMMDSLTAKFINLEISKTALYNFVIKKCKISLKRAHFHSVERNCLEKTTARKEWVEKWMATNLDYIMSNCWELAPLSKYQRLGQKQHTGILQCQCAETTFETAQSKALTISIEEPITNRAVEDIDSLVQEDDEEGRWQLPVSSTQAANYFDVQRALSDSLLKTRPKDYQEFDDNHYIITV
ncbi:Homeodomain-like DNA binding domain-containing transcription factor [Mucor lusitanicus CBS 277.49]|uniref:Homeodomain-like DNA binding domain-containing transcription factor n=1 Tax=Mucor lusitanicus CBS 277.49 TaxID=747725 RepID=A0A168NX39_MUCCL|nr:Homeodomain-like DNA binding domain-containing transcription factor [Mucor lusitanicus CBS 277.49]